MFRVLAIALISAASVATPVYTQIVSTPACAADARTVKKVHDLKDTDLVYQTGPTPKNQYIDIFKIPDNKFAIIFYDKNGCIDDIVNRDATGAFYFLEEGLKAD